MLRQSAALSLRSARADDSGLLLEWTNKMRACNLSLSVSTPLERARHDEWFAVRLKDPDCQMRIVEHAGMPVGLVRLEKEVGMSVGTMAVTVYITHESRRLGLASVAIEQALAEAASKHGAVTAIARVRHENEASRRLFGALGFVLVEEHADHVVFRRPVPA